MRSWMVFDSLAAQVVCRPGYHLGRGGEDVLDESSSKILNFNYFLLCCTILILFHAGTFSFGGMH
jgi:hypothetical protein